MGKGLWHHLVSIDFGVECLESVGQYALRRVRVLGDEFENMSVSFDFDYFLYFCPRLEFFNFSLDFVWCVSTYSQVYLSNKNCSFGLKVRRKSRLKIDFCKFGHCVVSQ